MAPNRPSLSSASLTIFLLLGSLPAASPFSFSYTAPTQCGQLSVAWQGGTAPYYLLITPRFSVPSNLTIPASAYSNGKGNYSTTLNVQSQQQFLLTMSDSSGSGFGSGGTSGLLTVGDPLSGSPSCNTTPSTVPWSFQLNSALQQCREFTFEFNGATAPVTIYGLIPLGTPFTLNPPNANNYTWDADLKAGTSLIWTAVDGQGRTGGSSDLLQTSNTDDTSCINSSSPSSTVTGPPSSTSAGGATGTSSPSSGGGGNGGVIGGAVAAGVVALLIIGSLLWFFCIRKRHNRKDTPHTSTRFSRRLANNEPVDLDPHEPSSAVEAPGSHYEPEPYLLPVPATATTTTTSDGSHYPPGHPGAAWRVSTTTDEQSQTAGPSTRTSKYSEAFRNPPPNTPARFVLHTDAGEVAESNDEPEVVELPPQYDSLGGRVPARAPTYRERLGDARRGGAASSSGPANSSASPATGESQASGPSS